jgi:transcriptional regulator with XRE-family HTH domain
MKNEVSVLIGKRLKQLRKNRKWTQEAMAEKLGLDANYYATVERGEKQFSVGRLFKVIEVLCVSATDILPSVETKKPFDNTIYKNQIDAITKDFSEEQYATAIRILKAMIE